MSKEFLKVEGEEGLYRDPTSKAIINKNKKAWLNHKVRRRKLQEKNQEIEDLKNDVAELKELVKQLVGETTPKTATKRRTTNKSTESE